MAHALLMVLYPLFQVLDDAFGVESGTITTIISSMNDQPVIDAYHPDLRRTRAASPIYHSRWILA